MTKEESKIAGMLLAKIYVAGKGLTDTESQYLLGLALCYPVEIRQTVLAITSANQRAISGLEATEKANHAFITAL